METCLLRQLEAGTGNDVQQILEDFNLTNEKLFGWDNFDQETYQRLWKAILDLLEGNSCSRIMIAALSTLRILSRNKKSLEENVTNGNVDNILTLADLMSETDVCEHHNRNVDYDVVIEAQKCLSNMIFNSLLVQQWCCMNSFIPGLMRRLKVFRDTEIPHQVRWFDIRLTFLLSGLQADIRSYLRTECHGFSYFIEILDSISKPTEHTTDSDGHLSTQAHMLDDKAGDLINEALKTLYNILHTLDRSNPDEEDEHQCRQLVVILRRLLLSSVNEEAKTEDLHSNTVNLLLLMPPHLYEGLLQPMPQVERPSLCGAVGGVTFENECIAEYDGTDMSAITRILAFLHRRLNNPGKSAMENVAPVLSLMIDMTLNNRIIRKFVRQKILPPLKDVSKRPEEGDSIRNRLCAFMTSPIRRLKNASADLLFILCKEKVERLIKYTGYGNAAGLLAARGLMLGGKGRSAEYSSDSDVSDTEEYERVKDQVNPVTGRLEPPHTSPFDGMTEEQKEHEAMKLVNALDKLNRANVIQPCIIGNDGKPRPLKHVNELRESSGRSEDSEPSDQSEDD